MRSPQSLKALKKRIKTLEKVFFEYAQTTSEQSQEAFNTLANNYQELTKYLIELKQNQDILFKSFSLITEYFQQLEIKRKLLEINKNLNEKLNEKVQHFA